MKAISSRMHLGLLLTAACVTLPIPAHAAVTWLAFDDGVNLTLTTDGGDINIGSDSGHNISVTPTGYLHPDSREFFAVSGSFYIGSTGSLGSLSGLNPLVGGVEFITDLVSGDPFGFSGTGLYWDLSLGSSPGIITPISSMTFNGETVASVFGSNLNAGPVVLWTHNTTGDTISVALIPEPSSAFLLCIGGGALMLRRRK